ncbi:hypothetical protein [Aeromonas hydrophila]|uniref:hypothetical protein n=1 Tax=Aeromonas hydrophila TaxID=644 RepID=UPI002B46D183|nr:hypothetical protein [Aeromonas hydrophila]
MTKESNTKPLIPLEYCSPERAASIFCCEVEDILHWASIGAIRLHAQFPDPDYSDGEACSVGEIYLNDSLIEYEKFKEVEYIQNGVVGYKKISYGDAGPINERSNHLFVDPSYFSFGASMWMSEPNHGYNDRIVSLSGFWEVDSKSIYQMLLPAKGQGDDYWYLKAIYTGNETSTEPEVGVGLCAVTLDDMPSRLRVMREDLLKIQQHLSSGELMSRTKSQPMPVSKERHSHPTAERFAVKREKVLAAAIHAREEWPEECKDATAWAAVLVDHSFTLFGTKEPPISQEQMCRQLSEALKRGQPYRKN